MACQAWLHRGKARQCPPGARYARGCCLQISYQANSWQTADNRERPEFNVNVKPPPAAEPLTPDNSLINRYNSVYPINKTGIQIDKTFHFVCRSFRKESLWISYFQRDFLKCIVRIQNFHYSFICRDLQWGLHSALDSSDYWGRLSFELLNTVLRLQMMTYPLNFID